MAAPGLQKEKNEIMEVIKKKAAVYTAEWKFDTEQPDMGTVLAVLFADMMEETEKKFQRLYDNYQIQFYNLLEEKVLPANEAKGYVTFSTVNDEVPGAYVKENTRVLGDAGEDHKVFFETQMDLYVSPARLKTLFYVNGKKDYISHALDLPFRIQQENNQQSHVCYIGHDTAFCIKTDGDILLDFQFLQDGIGTEPESLFMNQITWSYYSKDGFVEFPGFRYEAGKIYLHKDKTMPVFEQTQIQGKQSYWLKLEADCLKPESRIAFQKLFINSSGHYLQPETIYDGNMELDAESFFPFGERPYPYAEIYIASEEVFSKKGAFIQMDFELDFIEAAGEIKSPEIPIRWHNIMHQKEFSKPEPVDVLIHSVIWEYYNGYGWTRIPDTKRYEDIFGDKQQQRVTVSFLCPEDIHPFLLAAKQSYCIRVRISKMTNLYTMDGIYIVPNIRNLTMHYQYTEAQMLPDCVYAFNHLCMEKLNCSQEFVPFYNSYPGQEMLYLCFSRPLEQAGISILFVLEKEKRNLLVRYHYEYYGKNGWQLLQVEDETKHLLKTGIVTIYKEHMFQEQEFFGRRGFWIRIVQETSVEVPQYMDFARITGIYMNSAAIFAQKESGAKGNLPAGTIQALERSIGFINKVTNHEAVVGGCDEESGEQAVKRVASALRHQERAVTTKDYEDIVQSGVRNILQVRCFSGRDATGKKLPGHITLAVLPEKGNIYERYFEHMKEEVYQCLMPHIDQRIYKEGRLHVVKPEWVFISLYMTIVVKNAGHFYQLKEKVSRRINAFLDPVSGNFDGKGWKIGILPTILQIQNICSQMDEILYVKSISWKDEGQDSCYVLGIGGEHEIEVIPE